MPMPPDEYSRLSKQLWVGRHTHESLKANKPDGMKLGRFTAIIVFKGLVEWRKENSNGNTTQDRG